MDNFRQFDCFCGIFGNETSKDAGWLKALQAEGKGLFNCKMVAVAHLRLAMRLFLYILYSRS